KKEHKEGIRLTCHAGHKLIFKNTGHQVFEEFILAVNEVDQTGDEASIDKVKSMMPDFCKHMLEHLAYEEFHLNCVPRKFFNIQIAKELVMTASYPREHRWLTVFRQGKYLNTRRRRSGMSSCHLW